MKKVCKVLANSMLKALANGGIFLGISVEMMLAGLRDGYS